MRSEKAGGCYDEKENSSQLSGVITKEAQIFPLSLVRLLPRKLQSLFYRRGAVCLCSVCSNARQPFAFDGGS